MLRVCGQMGLGVQGGSGAVRAAVPRMRMLSRATPAQACATQRAITSGIANQGHAASIRMRTTLPRRLVHSSAAVPVAMGAPSSVAAPASGAAAGARVPLDWPVGFEALGGFRVVSRTPVSDFNLTVYRLEHAASGALAYHVARADADNAFSVAFRTPVDSNNGVAHILEHTVLCGSERYPVRDPFFLLVRRSLKTFMNAMTAQDYTLYPFSTCNEKDFNNLLEVYLDAAFFPLLNTMDFKQEGHRLEIAGAQTVALTGELDASASADVALAAEDATLPSTAATAAAGTGAAVASPPVSSKPSAHDLEIKGVVFNEMKGAMSDTSQLFLQKLQEQLFPSNCNHWNSGGDPSAIPTLTHEQLKDFHARHYNIENAVFLSYGDMAPPLATINERVLQPVLKKREELKKQGKSVVTHKPPQYTPERRFTAPQFVRSTCPPDPLIPDPAKQTKVCTSYLCKPLEGSKPGELGPEGEVEAFALSMLSSLLIEGPTAPLYQALIDPNIGSGYAPGTGYDHSTQEPTFGLGLQGIAESDVDRVLELIDATLRRVAVEGFPAERVEAIIHQLELSLKHVRSNFGIGLVMRMTPYWAHGADPLSPLRVNAHIAALREKLAQGPYFQQLIQKHLLDNPHQVTLVMAPDAEYARKETEAENAKLATQAAQLTAAQREEIATQARQLVQLQNSKPDTKSCNLPSLSASDISKTAELIHMDTMKLQAGRITVQKASQEDDRADALNVTQLSSLPRLVSLTQPTNGVGYVRGIVSAKRVPLDLRLYLPLYTSFLTEMGAGSMDSRALAHALDMSTGGISAELTVFAHLDDLHRHEEVVLFKSLALERNIPRMLDLFRTVLQEVRFDDLERLQQLLLQTAAACSSSLQDSGSSYATSDAAQHLFPSAAVNEIYGGIRYVTHINSLVASLTSAPTPEAAKSILADVAHKLTSIARILAEQGMERTFVVGDEPALEAMQKSLPSFLAPPSSAAASGSGAQKRSLVDFPFQPAQAPVQTFYALPLQVHNVSLVLPTVPYTHADGPKLDVLARILSSVYIHREVREKGGAYGGGVSHSSDGVLAFSSYRDPNTTRTLDAYHGAAGWLAQGDHFGENDIDEALLSIFSGIDAPKPPSAKGMGQFLFGVSNAQRQNYRDRLLAVRKDDVMEVCEKYLSPARMERAAHVTIVGDESSVPTEIRNSDKWKVQQLHLAAAAAGGADMEGGPGGEEGGQFGGQGAFDEEYDDDEFDDDEEITEGERQRRLKERRAKRAGGAAMGVVTVAAAAAAADDDDDDEPHPVVAEAQPGQSHFSAQMYADAGAASIVFGQHAAAPRSAPMPASGAGGLGGAPAAPAPVFPPRASFNLQDFLPDGVDFDSLRPVSPWVQGVVALVAGYAGGYLARVCTRLTILLVGVSGACVYLLHRHGVVEVKWDRLKSISHSVMQHGHGLQAAVERQHPDFVAQLQGVAETLLTTPQGIAFSTGFMLAFK